MELIITAVVTITIVVAIHLTLTFTYWSRRNVKTLPFSLLFRGIADILLQRKPQAYLIQSAYTYFKNLGLQYGGFYLLTQPVLVITDTNLARRVLTTNFDHFTDSGVATNPNVDPLNGGMFFLNGLKWKQVHDKLSPLFHSERVKQMVGKMVKQEFELEPGLVDIKAVVENFTLKINSSCIFGIDYSDDFRKYGKSALRFSTIQRLKLLFCTVFPKIGKWLEIVITKSEVTKFFTETAGITAVEHYNVGLDKLELVAQLYSFFMAGFETSAATLSFLIYELAKNPEIQEKVREEVFRASAERDVYETLAELKFTTRCINETLRKYSPFPTITRKCTKPYKISETDLIIDKDVLICLSVYAIQNDPQNFPEPERFDPKRSLSCNWMPFGQGPRSCIGIRLAYAQTKVALLKLLKNYRFSVHPKTPESLVMDPKCLVEMTVKDHLWIEVERIDDWKCGMERKREDLVAKA